MKKLLIVDMQKGFINNNNAFLVKNIENLMKNGNFDQIVATRFVNHKNSQYEKFLNWTKLSDQESQSFAINLPEYAKVCEKSSYGMRGGDLACAINENDEVYLCGTDHDACVLAIAYQLFDYGVQPHIVMNCVGSHSENPAISKEDFEKLCLKNFGKNSVCYL